MSQIQVSLDTTASPPVTCSPKHQSVNNGNQTLNWTPAQSQNFAFKSLVFLNNPSCFSTPTVSASQITVTDNNTAAGDYPYVLTVTYNGTDYSTSGGIAGGGGDPSIKNN